MKLLKKHRVPKAAFMERVKMFPNGDFRKVNRERMGIQVSTTTLWPTSLFPLVMLPLDLNDPQSVLFLYRE